MTEWRGSAAPGLRPQPEDDATRQARHDVLATLLGAYADGELPPETMVQVEAHLLGCDRCRREVRVQQQLADQLATLALQPAPPALAQRLRAVTAVAPASDASVASPVPPSRSRLRRLLIAGTLFVTALGAWATLRGRDVPTARADAERRAAPMVLTSAPRIVSAVVGDYRQTSQRDLPGRARDLDAVRAAVGFPIVPLRGADVRLIGAWTVELDGELAAVLAYRWQDRLVLQYGVPDGALFRSYELRRAISDGRAVAEQLEDVGVLAWSEPQGGTLLVTTASWPALQSLRAAR